MKPNEATLHDKISIINWKHANGKSQVTTVKHFNENGLGVDQSAKLFR